MRNTNKTNELLLLATKNLINKQFEDLGNFLGDLLATLEVQVTQNKTTADTAKISKLLDKHAESADQILAQSRIDLISEIDRLVSSLFVDLNKSNRLEIPRELDSPVL